MVAPGANGTAPADDRPLVGVLALQGGFAAHANVLGALGAAVREVRATQGASALLKILPVDSASRVPERWAMLTPFPEL